MPIVGIATRQDVIRFGVRVNASCALRFHREGGFGIGGRRPALPVEKIGNSTVDTSCLSRAMIGPRLFGYSLLLAIVTAQHLLSMVLRWREIAFDRQTLNWDGCDTGEFDS